MLCPDIIDSAKSIMHYCTIITQVNLRIPISQLHSCIAKGTSREQTDIRYMYVYTCKIMCLAH